MNKLTAYLHLRKHGCTPKQAIQYVRCAGLANEHFELSFHAVCVAICIPHAFESLLACVNKPNYENTIESNLARVSIIELEFSSVEFTPTIYTR